MKYFAYFDIFISFAVCTEDQKTDRSNSWQKSRTLLKRRADLDLVPYFDNSTSRNITTTSGKTAYLPCRVRHLGERTVSWICLNEFKIRNILCNLSMTQYTIYGFPYYHLLRRVLIHWYYYDIINYPEKSRAFGNFSVGFDYQVFTQSDVWEETKYSA